VPILSSAWGATGLQLYEGGSWVDAFTHWYRATSLGLLIVCPSLLIWSTPELRPTPSRGGIARMGVLATGLGLLTVFVFKQDGAAWMFLIFPALLLMVWVSDLAGASIGALLVVAVGVAETLAGNSVIITLLV
jgi:hypothetical protein